MSKKLPFSRVELRDDALLIGARWWQESMAQMDPIARRNAIIAIGAALGVAGLLGFAVAAVAKSSSGPTYSGPPFRPEDSLAAQKKYGFSLGSEALHVPFPSTQSPFDRAILDRLTTDLAPKTGVLRPYYVPTLFQSLTATPTAHNPSGHPIESLRETLPGYPEALLESSLARGSEHAAALASANEGKAVIVDLEGPGSVAYATTLATVGEPVFVFDNWPHPKGVVASHLTLAAVATFGKRLVDAATSRKASAPPVFVLDANRLAPYSNASDLFDNRYMAKLPSAAGMKALGITEITYVHANAVESDDLNADFVAYEAAGIAVKLLAPTGPLVPSATYKATARATAFNHAGSTNTRPADFGVVELSHGSSGELVAVSFATAVVVTHVATRSGSYSRTTFHTTHITHFSTGG